VPVSNDKIYRFADLKNYSFKERSLIRLADMVFFLSIKFLGITTRFEVQGGQHLDLVESEGHQPILGLWHERIFLGTYFLRGRGIVVLTSKSFDGEYIARFIQRFGFGAIRGSSSRSASRALIEMIRAMRDGLPMALTLDGPRGPRQVAKPGAVLLAKKTGNPIVPFLVESKNFWTVNSWDKMQVPMPFTKAVMIIGEPIYVGSNADQVETAVKLEELQSSLNDLAKRGKEWSARCD
jgi:lysophospholipid acyltransferase (LPLAT)-like uncharacterized protein